MFDGQAHCFDRHSGQATASGVVGGMGSVSSQVYAATEIRHGPTSRSARRRRRIAATYSRRHSSQWARQGAGDLCPHSGHGCCGGISFSLGLGRSDRLRPNVPPRRNAQRRWPLHEPARTHRGERIRAPSVCGVVASHLQVIIGRLLPFLDPPAWRLRGILFWGYFPPIVRAARNSLSAVRGTRTLLPMRTWGSSPVRISARTVDCPRRSSWQVSSTLRRTPGSVWGVMGLPFYRLYVNTIGASLYVWCAVVKPYHLLVRFVS